MNKYFEEGYDYDRYIETQKSRAKSKWGAKTFDKGAWQKSRVLIWDKIKHSKSIICMGIRNGNEYKMFKDKNYRFEAEVYGVDISPEVLTVGDKCFAYDFSELPKEWENKFDLIYSNSIDHSYDLDKTINEWYRISKNNGYWWLVLSTSFIIRTDIYSFEKDDVPKIFDDKRFEIVDIWDGDENEAFNTLLRVKK